MNKVTQVKLQDHPMKPVGPKIMRKIKVLCFLSYLDKNKLYGKAMPQKLSANGFAQDEISKLTENFMMLDISCELTSNILNILGWTKCKQCF